ncbi:conserved hypothetical protein [Pseudomonas sp. 8O]|nr:conserved hypothetical protein [Pseudomonas sp. 8O]
MRLPRLQAARLAMGVGCAVRTKVFQPGSVRMAHPTSPSFAFPPHSRLIYAIPSAVPQAAGSSGTGDWRW